MTQTIGRKRQAKLKKYTKRNAEQSRKFEFIYQNAKENKKEFERIHKKLEEHDREFLLIHKKLEEHDKKFVEHDGQFAYIHKKLEQHDKKFKEHDDTLERIVNKLLEHDVRLENIEQNMATKQDLNEIKNTLDALVKMFDDRTKEIVVVAAGIRRLDDVTDHHETILANYGQDLHILKQKTGLI